MKVVFLEDVPNVARAGEMKEVADGYGRNFLIPRKLAVVAGAQVINEIEAHLKKKAHLQAQTEAEMKGLADQLEGKEIVLRARAGDKDRLYGSITNADIAEELEKSTGLVIDKRKIELDESIREVGNYEIAIRLTGDIIPKIKLTVMEEEKKESKEKREKKAEKAEGKDKAGKVEEEKKEGKGKKGSKAEKTEEKKKEGKKESKEKRKKKAEKAEGKGKDKVEEAGEEEKGKEEESEEQGEKK